MRGGQVGQLWGAGLFVALTLALAGQAAEAQDVVHWGAGGKMGVNASLLTPPLIIAEPNPPIPAFLGSGGGVGVALQALYGDYVGLGLEFWTVSATGRGRYTFVTAQGQYYSIDQELASREIQIPLLLRGQLPLRYVQPFATFGATFVFQTDASWTVDADVTTELVPPETRNYTMLTGSLGANIEVKNIRIPIELRGTWQSIDRDPHARATWDYEPSLAGGLLTTMSVWAQWEAQLWVMVGVEVWGVVDPWRREAVSP